MGRTRDRPVTLLWQLDGRTTLQHLAVLNTSFHRALGMACNPYTVLTGREPGKDLSAKLKTEAESRRNYKLYIKGSIPEGTPVKVSMRWMVLVV
jgi:hypothetical protein